MDAFDLTIICSLFVAGFLMHWRNLLQPEGVAYVGTMFAVALLIVLFISTLAVLLSPFPVLEVLSIRHFSDEIIFSCALITCYGLIAGCVVSLAALPFQRRTS